MVAIVAGTSHNVELRLRSGRMSTGRLIGRVRDAATQRPVTAAAISLAGRAEASETNRQGQFVLSGVPVGAYELSVRSLGYAPLVHPVVVSRGTTTEIEIGLVPDPVEMEPIVATATRSRRLEVKGFYERKYWGELVSGGTFFTVADIERRNPVLISHMIADLSGIRLDCGMRRDSCRIMNMRGSSGFAPGGCRMRIHLDGVPLGGGGRGNTLDDFVRPVEVAGIEVYKGPASLPAEFSGSDSGCGVVAIWTK
ncbi:MAG: carboxypeptidase regulatory-like domain-containing protein [Gemmatimonadota bacterium]|uniref:carboxypeptidase regulatory-like domain-containing protein n=1 Tax=Candidatus Palauibacter scopulicola TaxID=3056741 RepID=UPI00238D045F|nr:carboxypeptidase regulatory-like domain-containing protein [Candidatus Palauibacter scopulicola]MDE2661458.1 carboxypeptidase regulatory-like domain-containing protein [Candidatus Palauibacter scopulicola]